MTRYDGVMTVHSEACCVMSRHATPGFCLCHYASWRVMELYDAPPKSRSASDLKGFMNLVSP